MARALAAATAAVAVVGAPRAPVVVVVMVVRAAAGAVNKLPVRKALVAPRVRAKAVVRCVTARQWGTPNHAAMQAVLRAVVTATSHAHPAVRQAASLTRCAPVWI